MRPIPSDPVAIAAANELDRRGERARKATPVIVETLRDVAAILPVAGRAHPKDIHALQARVCALLERIG